MEFDINQKEEHQQIEKQIRKNCISPHVKNIFSELYKVYKFIRI